MGGRRWAKHAKYLNRLGIETHVLSCQFPESTSPWDRDVLEYEKFVTRIKVPKFKIPYFKKVLPVSIFQKIIWKLSLWSFRITEMFSSKISNDESANTASFFLIAAQQIIEKESINSVILSVGPHRYSEVLVLLKNKYPDIKYILDDRDYWDEEFLNMGPKELSLEKEFQKKVINSVDLMITPYEKMAKIFRNGYHNNVYHLPHAVDLEDIPKSLVSDVNSTIKIVYGGAFYSKIHNNIYLIKQFVDLLNQKKKVEVEFYVSVKGYEKELEHPFIKRYGFIDSEKYFAKVNESDYVILILPPIREYAMSSKFFELVAMRKPILYFGGEDEVSQFIIKNKLGYHITVDNLIASTIDVFNNIKTHDIPDKNYSIESHTFENQTKLLIEELEKI